MIRSMMATMHAAARAALLGVAFVIVPAAQVRAQVQAQADPWADACLVRAEAPPAAGQTMSPPAPAQSSLGWRRTRTRLVDVSMTIVGANAVCSISGVGRLRSDADGGTLVFPVRADPALHGRPSDTCIVTLHAAGAAVVVSTSPACRAQAVCDGRVDLDGQRFELAGAAPNGAAACFEGPRLVRP